MKVSSSVLRGRKATYLNLPVMSEIVLDYLKKRQSEEASKKGDTSKITKTKTVNSERPQA